MQTRLSALLAGAAVLATLGATAASAATIIVPIPGGPFNLVNSLATLPGTILNKANTYDFTFTMDNPLKGSVSTVQIQAQAQHTGDNETITFDLYSGDPGGTHGYLATSSTGTNANILYNATPGDYYVQITPAYIKQGVNKEALSGTILTSSVPEPAAWGMMLLGFGVVGGSLRVARRRPGALISTPLA
jgi:hypothetical protein